MLVKLLKTTSFIDNNDGKLCKGAMAGTEVDVDPEVAGRWISRKIAAAVDVKESDGAKAAWSESRKKKTAKT